MHGEKKVRGKTVRLVQEDITLLDAQAFVYYAQNDLKLGSGYGNAIAARGGPGIQKELDQLGTAETCDAVVSSAGNLKAEFIIHAVGPKFQEPDIEGKLYTTTQNALKKADEKGVKSVAVPAMGHGFYGVPLEVSAKVTLGAIKGYLESNDSALKEVVVCVNDPRQVAPFKAQLLALA